MQVTRYATLTEENPVPEGNTNRRPLKASTKRSANWERALRAGAR